MARRGKFSTAIVATAVGVAVSLATADPAGAVTLKAPNNAGYATFSANVDVFDIVDKNCKDRYDVYVQYRRRVDEPWQRIDAPCYVGRRHAAIIADPPPRTLWRLCTFNTVTGATWCSATVLEEPKLIT